MKLSAVGLCLLLAPTTIGCGMLMPHGGSGSGGSAGGSTYHPGQDVKDTVRAGEAKSDQTTDPILDQEIAKQEKDVLHAIAMTQGKEGMAAGMPPYEPASQALTELRAAKFKLRIEPVTNAAGGAVGGGSFVQLKDSFTDKLQANTATQAERVAGVKSVGKLVGLKMQVQTVSMAALMTNTHVINGSLTAMLQISGMVAVRKQQEMEWTDDDYARVKRILTRQKHWEAMGAATMGMLAAYEAIVGTTTGDPKALDAIADSTSKAFPLDPQVSDDDVKNYVSHLTDNVATMKSKYETMMRGAMGDQVYEAQYKAGIDGLFARAAGAADTKSVSQVQADVSSKYQADLAKCARGEQPDPGSMVGPAKCKEAYANAQAGGGGGGGDSSGSGAGGGGSMVPGGVQNGVNKVQSGIGLANAVANGDAAGAIQNAADMFPGDGPIQSSLQGVAALTKATTKARSSQPSGSRASSREGASSRRGSASRASCSACSVDRRGPA